MEERVRVRVVGEKGEISMGGEERWRKRWMVRIVGGEEEQGWKQGRGIWHGKD